MTPKIKKSKKGNFYHSREIGADEDFGENFWTLYKSERRPDWLSVSRAELPGSRHRKRVAWFAFVWGETKDEVADRIGKLADLLRSVTPEEIAARAAAHQSKI